jgi:glycosyltransferase involved in cell wall biosynthesis
MKILFLVNGWSESADASRAESFARSLPKHWSVRVEYRPTFKPKGIFQFLRAACAFRPHVIYVVKVAYAGVVAGWLAKLTLRSRLICDTGDVAYELAKSTGRYSFVQLQMIHGVEQLAMRGSNAVVVRGSDHAPLLHATGVNRVEFIPDGVDLVAEPLAGRQACRDENHFGTDLVVGVIGSMEWSQQHGMCYGWDIVEAMAHLKDVSIKALLVGDGDGRVRLERRAAELGVSDRIVFVGRQPASQLGRFLAAMDVCVSTQSADAVGMVRTTGKLPLYLAYGKYVIATKVGEARKVLRSAGCLLPYEGIRDDAHPERLALHLRHLASNRHLVDVSADARTIAATHFDYKLLGLRVQSLCNEMVGSSAVEALQQC